METTACAPAPSEAPSAGGPDRTATGLANRLVVAAIGLGTALAASMPALLGVSHATFGPPEIALAVGGLAVGGLALAQLLRPAVPDGRRRTEALEAGMNGPRAALIGAGIGLPLLRFTGRIVIETDSARLLASVVHARNYGYGQVRHSQEALLPHAVYRPVLALAGLPGARLVAVLGAVALVATVAYLAWRTTGSAVATVGAAVAIVSMRFTMTQAPLLPLYPLMLTAGYLGGFLLWRAASADGRHRWWLTGGGVLAIAAAPELHSLGQLFYAAPLVVAVLAPAGRRLKPTLIAYAGLAVATLPRLAVNLSDGGLRYVRSGRVEWFVQQGYLDLVNSAKHQTPTHLGYLRKGPELLADALGEWGFVWIALVVVALVAFVPNRVRVATLAATAIVIGAIVVQQPGPFPRYLSPLLPGFAVLIGWLIARVAAQPGRALRLAVVPVLALVVVSGFADYRYLLNDERVQETARGAGRLQTMADIVGSDSVFGARAPKLIGYNAQLDPWGLSFVSEEEYRTYLTWPTTAAVVAMLRRHGIEYVAVTDREANEIDYNQIWLGSRPRHRRELIVSRGAFCPVWHAFPLALYRVGACQAGDEGATQ